MKKFFLTALFWIVLVIVIHMAVFMTTGKTVAQLLGFIGVIAQTFGSLFLARWAAKRMVDPKLPSGQSLSLAQARADAIDEAIANGELDEGEYTKMIALLKEQQQRIEEKNKSEQVTPRNPSD